MIRNEQSSNSFVYLISLGRKEARMERRKKGKKKKEARKKESYEGRKGRKVGTVMERWGIGNPQSPS